MADYNSVEIAQVEGVGHDPLKPHEQHGRMRIVRFSFTTDASLGLVDGEKITACILPSGARIMEIYMVHGAMGGSGRVDIGVEGKDGSGFIDAAGSVADDDDLFGINISLVSAGELSAANTVALEYGYVTEKALYLTLTAETGNWTTSIPLEGHVVYVLD